MEEPDDVLGQGSVKLIIKSLGSEAEVKGEEWGEGTGVGARRGKSITNASPRMLGLAEPGTTSLFDILDRKSQWAGQME